MDTENKLIQIIRNINFNQPNIDDDLKSFFNIFLTLLDPLNVGAIISNVNIVSKHEMQIFFKGLFSNIKELSLKSVTSVKTETIKNTIDTLDKILPEILMQNTIKSKQEILKDYCEIRDEAFKDCFQLIDIDIQQYMETLSETKLLQIQNILIILSRLIDINYCNSFVYLFTNFLWHNYAINHNQEICRVLLLSLSNISKQLFKFLLWNNDEENNQLFIDLALTVYDSLKMDLINGRFLPFQIVYVLNILENRDRLIGQFVDAVPENTICDGYIISPIQSISYTDDCIDNFSFETE